MIGLASSDRIDELTLVDWPDGAPPPSFDTLRPSGLDDRGILLIRSVSVVAGASAVPSAVDDEVTRALARAARPSGGRIPLGADVIRFRDETEAIAAYLLAAAEGAVPGAWWCRFVARPGLPLATLLAAEHPAAVVVTLDGWGALDPLIGADADVLRAVTGRIAQAHGLAVTLTTGAATVTPAGMPLAARSAATPRRRPGEAPPRVVVSRAGTVIATANPTDAAALRRLVVEVARISVGVAPAPTRPGAPPGAAATEPPHRPPHGASSPHAGSAPQITGSLPTLAPVEPLGDGHHASAAPAGPAPRSARSDSQEGRTGVDRPPSEGTPTARPATAAAPGHARVAPPPAWSSPERRRCRSELGGALFLVNPIRVAALPDPLRAVAPWDLVEACARALLGDRDDLVWDVLADLAARPGEPVDAELCAAVEPFVHGLARDLGHDLDALADLLVVTGVIEYDATHVDVTMALGDVRLATRRIGLDLDPGWAPAFGRVIRFHYRDGRL